MTRKELSQKYWRYYLLLEKRFIESTEYVELHKDNFGTFSNGYALLIQAIGSELDTMFKEYCGFSTSEFRTISDYTQHIMKSYPDIASQKIVLQEYDIEIQPFKAWGTKKPSKLLWWDAFTSIKHNRSGQIREAKLKNVLNILGALYLLEMMFLKKITDNTDEIDVFDESSTLFTLRNWSSKAVPLSGAFALLGDMIEDKIDISDKKFDVS